MADYTVAEEQAEREFEQFCEAFDIDTDVENWDEEDSKDFDGLKKKVVRAIKMGKLTFNDENEPVLAIKSGDPLTFSEPTGGSLMASDKRKKNENVARINAIMAEMCGKPPAIFGKMAMSDYKICSAITTLFLA